MSAPQFITQYIFQQECHLESPSETIIITVPETSTSRLRVLSINPKATNGNGFPETLYGPVRDIAPGESSVWSLTPTYTVDKKDKEIVIEADLPRLTNYQGGLIVVGWWLDKKPEDTQVPEFILTARPVTPNVCWNSPVLITGRRGTGKTTLAKKWLQQFLKEEPTLKVVTVKSHEDLTSEEKTVYFIDDVLIDSSLLAPICIHYRHRQQGLILVSQRKDCILPVLRENIPHAVHLGPAE